MGILVGIFLSYSFHLYTGGIEENTPRPEMTNEARRGKIVFQEYNCISCHQIYGLGGYMGPDLSNVLSTQGKGEEYAKAFLKSGTQRMPNFELNDEEIKALIAYMKFVDASYHHRSNFTIGPLGNIENK